VSIKVRLLLASAFGLGLSPVAPGTCGALLGVAIHAVVSMAAPRVLQVWVLGAAFLAVCIANHLLTPWAQAYWKDKDPKHFVLDEVAGYLLVAVLFRQGHVWQVMLWGFLLVRALDVVKPPPAWYINKYGTGAWAILMDDIVAALYTVLALYVLKYFGIRGGIEGWLIS
jgi:phosphatidylglycerophosphatase A